MSRPRESNRLKAERAYVEQQCRGVICTRCGATLETYGAKCSADLSDACPGFLAIDKAKVEFNRKADGRSA